MVMRRLRAVFTILTAPAALAVYNTYDIELCASNGLLTKEQFETLKEAGVSRYHENIETSRRNFPNICNKILPAAIRSSASGFKNRNMTKVRLISSSVNGSIPSYGVPLIGIKALIGIPPARQNHLQ